VTERAGLRRAELALAVLAVTPALLVAIVAIDVVAYHGLDLHPQLALAVASVLVMARAVWSLGHGLLAQRAFLRRLPAARDATVDGHPVRILPGPGLHAFCVGLLRPAVYVSEGTLAGGDAELRAILVHEEHHRARRDPLRQLLARVVSDALRPLPPFAALADRQAALADLAADAATVEALGDRAPLASAMARFGESTGIAPERVDRLLGTARIANVPAAALAAAGAALLAITAAIATMLVGEWHLGVTLPLGLESAVLIALGAPACLAARRA
jgi:hypothetical protein